MICLSLDFRVFCYVLGLCFITNMVANFLSRQTDWLVPRSLCMKSRNVHRKTLVPESLFYSLMPATLTQVFSCEFCEHLSKNTFFYRTPLLAASVKACNFTKIRLRHGCFFVNFLKISEKRFLDALQEFFKSLQKHWWQNVC